MLCRKCEIDKPMDKFPPRGTPRAGTCRECRQDYNKAWNLANRETYLNMKRRSDLKQMYGITLDEFDAKLEEQGGRCAICRVDKPGGRGTWHVDHDHATGRFRGLLCWQCNRRLGEYERPEWHALAEAYLQRTRDMLAPMC